MDHQPHATDRDAFWRGYYGKVHRESSAWLDYSNEGVQVQSFALALESAGTVAGRSCLDVGCGKGQFASLLADLGSTRVTGVELVPETIAALAAARPDIAWVAGDAGDAATYRAMAPTDRVFALEVLQYLPFAATIRLLWSLVAPGGRLIGIMPNAACPIVVKPTRRFAGNFVAAESGLIAATLAALPEVDCWSHRGMAFAADQRISPYLVSPWTEATAWEEPPNRFQFVARRRDR